MKSRNSDNTTRNAAHQNADRFEDRKPSQIKDFEAELEQDLKNSGEPKTQNTGWRDSDNEPVQENVTRIRDNERETTGEPGSGRKKSSMTFEGDLDYPLDSDQKMAESVGLLGDKSNLQPGYEDTAESNANPETVAAIRDAVADDNADVGKAFSGRVNEAKGKLKKAAGTVLGNEDLKEGGDQDIKKGQSEKWS